MATTLAGIHVNEPHWVFLFHEDRRQHGIPLWWPEIERVGDPLHLFHTCVGRLVGRGTRREGVSVHSKENCALAPTGHQSGKGKAGYIQIRERGRKGRRPSLSKDERKLNQILKL